MGERSVIARALWELRGLGWRLDWVDGWPGGWRDFALRRTGVDRRLVFSAPPKGWDRG